MREKAMPATLTIRDESMTPGGADFVFELEFPTESVTVRELIRERVYQEVDDFNRAARTSAQAPRFRGLVQPTELEQELSPKHPHKVREVDWKAQFEAAVKAYELRRVLVLVGNHQTESLDEMIRIDLGMEVTFLRLVPLVGG